MGGVQYAPKAVGGFGALKKTPEAPYTTKVNNRYSTNTLPAVGPWNHPPSVHVGSPSRDSLYGTPVTISEAAPTAHHDHHKRIK
jgi:hypothetical protein